MSSRDDAARESRAWQDQFTYDGESWTPRPSERVTLEQLERRLGGGS